MSLGETTITRATCGSRIRAISHALPVTSSATQSRGSRLCANSSSASGRAAIRPAERTRPSGHDRDLAEVAVDVQRYRSHLASSLVDVGEPVGKRHRRIRARSATGQVAGAATEKPGLKRPSSKTACPACVLPKAPRPGRPKLAGRRTSPTPSTSSFMPRKAVAALALLARKAAAWRARRRHRYRCRPALPPRANLGQSVRCSLDLVTQLPLDRAESLNLSNEGRCMVGADDSASLLLGAHLLDDLFDVGHVRTLPATHWTRCDASSRAGRSKLFGLGIAARCRGQLLASTTIRASGDAAASGRPACRPRSASPRRPISTIRPPVVPRRDPCRSFAGVDS